MAAEDEGLQAPLLAADAHDPDVHVHVHSNGRGHDASAGNVITTPGDAFFGLDIHRKEIFRSWAGQGHMAWPLVLQFVSSYGLSIVSLSFLGHLGKQELAAAALGSSFVSVLGRVVMAGLNGALDTLASQAVGSGDLAALPSLFYRHVLFLLLHAIPVTLTLLAVPRLAFGGKGTDPELSAKAFNYLAYLLPQIWLDCLSRPLNTMLVSQRITRPQMVISLVTLAAHVATNYLFIHVLKVGYIGAAIALCCATVYSLIMVCTYIWWSGHSKHIWGTPTKLVFQGWKRHAGLAYPACLMRCAESLGFSLMTLLCSYLPDPSTAVAAASVAFNIYGILYMGFGAFNATAVTFVGNALGTGDARAAKVHGLSSILMSPLLWLVVGTALLEPHSQLLLIDMFINPGTEEKLQYHLHRLLCIVAALELFDGTQTIMSGVITGCGKQKHGAVINLVAFYVIAIPVAVYLGFKAELGVEGMYIGMSLGPLTQTLWYGSVLLNTDWQKEARDTQARLTRVRHT